MLLALGLVFFAVSGLAAQPSLQFQVEQTAQLIAAHRAALPRLIPIAETAAEVLMKGGGFFLCCGDNPWINEAENRAGGPIGLKVAGTAAQVTDNSVVWVSYTAATYKDMQTEVSRMPHGAYVVIFGPKPDAAATGKPWLDSLTPGCRQQSNPDGQRSFTLVIDWRTGGSHRAPR